jgi:hypothetical protein
LPRRSICPGSYRAEKDLPSETNEAAEEGTKLHAVMERVLKDPSEWINIDDLTDEQMSMCQFCYRFAENFRTGFEWHVEEWVDLASVHTEIEGGTADFVAVEPFKLAVVVDWKFGRGNVSRAEDSLQACAYAVGIAKKYDVPKVVTYIAHAPYQYISCFEYDEDGLRMGEYAIKLVVMGCLPENAIRVADPDACKYCKAAANCPEVQRLASTLAVVGSVEQLPVPTLVRLLDQCEIVDKLSGAVKQRARAILESGGQVPGWALKPGAKRRAWADGAQAKLEEVAKKLGLREDQIWEPKELVSPAGLEKSWGKKKEIVAAVEPLLTFKQNNASMVREKKRSRKTETALNQSNRKRSRTTCRRYSNRQSWRGLPMHTWR